MDRTLTPRDLQYIPDGTWIETDQHNTRVLRTWPMNTSRPADAVYLWRKKQLTDALEYAAYLKAV